MISDKAQGSKTVSICHVTSAHTRYDIRIFVKECVTLANLGYKVSLIVADDLGDEIKHGVNIIDVGKPSRRFSRMLKTPYMIYRKILELKFEVVHFHDPEILLIGYKLAKKGIQVIYDVHEDLPKQVQSKHWIPRMMRPLVSFGVSHLEQFCSKRFVGIITATPIIAKRFSRYNSHVIAVCNYPLLSELSNLNVNWDSRQDKLSYIGSISRTRGIQELVISLSISHLDLELAGLISGDISLENLSKLDGYQYVNYIGVLDREQIADLLSRVKIGLVTLLPTPSYVESLPIKLFEYMLAGIPVIASNFKLWQDIIKKYECGVLVNPHKPQEIANACVFLLNNQDIAKNMGENGRKAVLNYFNWEVESNKLNSFYKKLKTCSKTQLYEL
jgi:glycosyltransferase involved in cell wall biosynthesis